jgi:hypothetical protein
MAADAGDEHQITDADGTRNRHGRVAFERDVGSGAAVHVIPPLLSCPLHGAKSCKW